MSNMQLAKNLKYLREKNNLKQEEIGDIINLTRQAYSNYETLHRTPDIDTLMILANFYKVSLNDLIFCNLSESSIPFDGLSEGEIPYIYTRSEKTDKSEKIDVTIYLSENELDMIMKFRDLPPEKQELIKGFIGSK